MTDDFLSDEDKALFRASMRTVTPLKPNKKINTRSSTPNQSVKKQKKETFPESRRSEIFLSSFIQEEVQANTLLSWCHPSLPFRRFQALKKGKINLEARLDLHGLKPDEAEKKLCDFISHQHHTDKRCLLIIHGKGSLEGEPPVLKNLIHRWLPQFKEVLAFHSALPRHGGTGAVYVLLRHLKYQTINSSQKK
ncbi:DNA mismatch repair protein MutS [Legionella israelensis]|uniref:DNA mismatch repair protein MutS n=1 Tax=Legionella israelensis TaxID=454 RepID=A0AAX1EID0_9GAMM|nr:Smr/MutS family protein [Legionella israelensis]QBR84921.1 DNA mismatch repair protein MutS [Legionella israelensis]